MEWGKVVVGKWRQLYLNNNRKKKKKNAGKSLRGSKSPEGEESRRDAGEGCRASGVGTQTTRVSSEIGLKR